MKQEREWQIEVQDGDGRLEIDADMVRIRIDVEEATAQDCITLQIGLDQLPRLFRWGREIKPPWAVYRRGVPIAIRPSPLEMAHGERSI